MNLVIEGAEDDVRRSAIADSFINSLLHYLYHKEGILPTTILDGRKCPLVDSEMLNLKGIFGDLVVVFFDHETNFTGRAARIHPTSNNSNRYVVFLKVDGLSPREIYYSLCRDRRRDTFRHEMVHILDKKRRKTKKPFGEPETADSDGKSVDLTAYFNNSQELNAYFHNIAEPILARMRWMSKHGPDHVGLFPNLPDDYREFLADRLTFISGPERDFWLHLTKTNKRKVISRLSRLYDLFQKAIAALGKQGDGRGLAS